MKKLTSVLMAWLMMLTLIVGCATSAAEEKNEELTVAFIPKLTGSAFFDVAGEGAVEYAKNHGFKVEYTGNPEPNIENQIAIIKSSIERRVDAICISSLDATALDEALKEAKNAGIQVTTWDSDVSGDARSVMVSQGTPAQLGQMLVEMGAECLTARGKNPVADKIKYVWHYSQSFVTDQNSWQAAGEKYISETYPNWENVEPENYYSEQNADKALSVGRAIFEEHPDIDLIICNDSTALPGQAQAAQNLGLASENVSITGFAPPNVMREYCKAGIIERWGLWDCKIQGALGCYMAYYLASGNTVSVGEKIHVPEIGIIEIMPNNVLDENAYVSNDSGVVILPERLEFTIDNVDNYNY